MNWSALRNVIGLTSPSLTRFGWRRWFAGNELKHRVVRGAAGSVGLKLAFTALGFAASVLLARALGAKGYGLYTYCITIVTALAIPAQLGLREFVVRETAVHQVHQRWDLMRGLLMRSNQVVLASTLSLGLIALGLAWLLRGYYSDQALVTFGLALPLLPLLCLTRLREAALRGWQHSTLAQVPEMLCRFGILVAALLVVFAWQGAARVSVAGAMGLQVLALVVAFGIALMAYRSKAPRALHNAAPAFAHRTWLRQALPFMLIGAMQIVNRRTDLIMVGLFRPAQDIGLYRVAVQLGQLVAFPLGAMNMVVAPQFARLWAEGEHGRLGKLVRWNARAILLMAAGPAVAFLLAGQTLLGWVFGAEFTAAAWPLTILCLGQLVNAAMGSVGLLLNAAEQQNQGAMGVGLGALVNVVLNGALIPPFGLVGAAIATALSFVVWNVYLGAMVWRRLKINPTIVSWPTAR
jgi:O-antigen/teichoic acid export membrane protein